MATAENITDHTKDSQLKTPDIPDPSFVIHSTTRIAAPAALVFRTLRNTDTWRDWNKYAPQVSISFQPEDEDETTLAEIHQLVRNTSVAGSVDSAITDGAATSGGGLIGRRMSIEEEDGIRLSPPPVTRERLRSIGGASMASAGGRPSTSSGRPTSMQGAAALAVANVNGATEVKENGTAPATNGENSSLTHLSGAQRFQESRKDSLASDERPETPKKILVEAPQNPSVLVAAPATAASEKAQKAQKRKSGSVSSTQRRKLSINALYGEPSVRIQLGTKMTLHLRSKMPHLLRPDREFAVVVTDVSRPEDNEEMAAHGNGMFNGMSFEQQAHLKRMQTHLEASQPGVYRIMWTMQEKYSPPKSYPKWMLTSQRVHEIRKVVRGDGKEECVYEDWECWKGVLASRTAKKFKTYWQTRAEQWGLGLGEYCTALGGDVERRDFVC